VLLEGGARLGTEELSDIFAILKKEAKASVGHAAHRVIGAPAEVPPAYSVR
jgi:hypothetical protein